MFLDLNGKPMKTWSVFTGCCFSCAYCWAKRMAETRLAKSPKYARGFEPTFHPKELARKFRPGEFVFISSMGDISFIAPADFQSILTVIANSPETTFLLQTKNPRCFVTSEKSFPNIIVGTTIETNRDTSQISEAPLPKDRYHSLCLIPARHFLSIEPIMDFDLDGLLRWIEDINPEIIEIGADNYKNNLPEPSWDKVENLLDELTYLGFEVKQKEGLERLRR